MVYKRKPRSTARGTIVSAALGLTLSTICVLVVHYSVMESVRKQKSPQPPYSTLTKLLSRSLHTQSPPQCDFFDVESYVGGPHILSNSTLSPSTTNQTPQPHYSWRRHGIQVKTNSLLSKIPLRKCPAIHHPQEEWHIRID